LIRQVENDLAVKVFLDLAVLGNAEDGILAVHIWPFINIDIEPSLHKLLTRRDRLDDLLSNASLVQRCHALLAVEQQLFGRSSHGIPWRTLNWPSCECLGSVGRPRSLAQSRSRDR